MKKFSEILTLAFLVAFTFSQIQAQEVNEQKTTQKEVVIVKKVIDENGNETLEEIKLTGEDAEAYIRENGKIIEENGEIEISIDATGSGTLIEKEIEVEEIVTEEKQMYKVVEIDDEGNKIEIEWDGEGEMPEKMKKIMDEHGIDEISKEVDIDSDGPDQVKKIKIVENNNGEVEERIITLEGDEELPEDVKKMLEEKGIDLSDLENGQHRVVKKMKCDKGTMSCTKEEMEKCKAALAAGGEWPFDCCTKEEFEACCGSGKKGGNKAQLGVMIEETEDGVQVVELVKGGAAAESGIQVGDIIQKVGKVKTADVEALIAAIGEKAPGDEVKLKLLRDGSKVKQKVVLKEQAKRSCGKSASGCCSKAKSKSCSKEKAACCSKGQSKSCNKEKAACCSKGKEAKKVMKEEIIEIKVVEEGKEENEAENIWVQQDNTLEIQEIDLYPNPTDGTIRLKFRSDKSDSAQIKVIDPNGRVVYENVQKGFSGSFDEELDFSGAPSGNLILVIEQGGKIFTEKIILK